MERLRESYSFSADDFTVVTDDKKYQKLTESTNDKTEVGDIVRLVERLLDTPSLKEDQILLDVLNKLRERGAAIDRKTWRLPIGRFDNLNNNKRIYPKQLWENVKNNQQNAWCGIAGLCDHPEKDNDPGKVRDSAIVWLDMEVGDNGVVYGIGRFCGPYGHMAEEILECGGRIGLSSSGFGDVNKVTKIVDPSTFIIERLADIVINPSQGVYGSIDDTHTSSTFMKDITQGGSLEFNNKIQEQTQSAILRRTREMADQQTTADAAVEQQQQSGAAPAAETAAPAQNPQEQLTESKKIVDTDPIAVRKSLTKIEEKIFRKHVEQFMSDADDVVNPISRLNECKEILNVFEEGACPDLREKLLEKITEEQTRLEKLVEDTVEIHDKYGVDIAKLEENAVKITQQGLLLKEQVTDYKELCEALQSRNKRLVEDNKKLMQALKLNEKIVKQSEVSTVKKLAETSNTADALKERTDKLESRNTRLTEKIQELSMSNKQLEKEKGLIDTKLREAVKLIKAIRESSDEDEEKFAKLIEDNKQLQSRLIEAEKAYEISTRRLNVLTEAHEKLQESIENENPANHVVPRAAERVGKFLNFRESRGAEVEDYWNDLVDQYGDSVQLFESEIRGAKTLREATSRFLKYRTEIDPDFAAGASVEQYAIRNTSERQKLLESQGAGEWRDGLENATNEALNEEFMRRAKAHGLR